LILIMKKYWFKTSSGSVVGMHGFGEVNALANLRHCLPQIEVVYRCDSEGNPRRICED